MVWRFLYVYNVCDKNLCRTRKFGIGGESVFPILSDLQKVLLDEPSGFELPENGFEVEDSGYQAPSQINIPKLDTKDFDIDDFSVI